MSTTCNRPGWGAYHRCEEGGGFYVLNGKVTRTTRQGGGVAPFDVPCATCGGQTFATHSASLGGLPTMLRKCWNGHVAHHVPGTNEFICHTEKQVAYDGPCVICHRPRASTRSWKVRKCSACDKRLYRARSKARANLGGAPGTRGGA